MNTNQPITAEELARIRALDDFDLIMLLSEIHDYGWPVVSYGTIYERDALKAPRRSPPCR